MSAKATKSTLGHASAQRATSMPRAPMPMIPIRIRSLAPNTPLGEASVVARPVAMVPINLRRESIIIPFSGAISILEHKGGCLVHCQDLTSLSNCQMLRRAWRTMKLTSITRYSFSGLLLVLPLAAGTVRIIQTNSAGDNVHIIDPATNKIVGVIKGIEVNHGAAVAPDGSRYYFSNEAESTLDVVDTKTLRVTRNIP